MAVERCRRVASQENIDMYRYEKNVSILFDTAVYRYVVIFIDTFPIASSLEAA